MFKSSHRKQPSARHHSSNWVVRISVLRPPRLEGFCAVMERRTPWSESAGGLAPS